jgi:NitT/TauT family transport system ATP-binding protein
VSAPIISISHVEKIFASQGKTPLAALRDINLSISSGEFITFIGSSGCGKTTLLRLIADLEEVTSGSIKIKEKTPERARLDRDYGYVFQSPALYEWRTVKQNVQLPLEVMRRPTTERDERAKLMLDLVGLSEFAGRYPWQLSGGMQQRVSIARALSFSPSILLMDEPFGALDEITREQLQLELLEIQRRFGTTVLFVTHSIPEAVFLSTRTVVLSPRPGRIHEIIPIDLPQPRTTHTREMPRFFELTTLLRESLRQIGIH